MILVDTNIIIDFWKNPSQRVQEIFENKDIAVCGITKAELIHGAKSEKEIEIIIEALEDFEIMEIRDSDWIEIGRLLYQLKRKGISVPFQDAVIAHIAMERDMDLWTNDKHFKLIQNEIKQLRILNV